MEPTESASCLSDALILSGLRGGGSGGSEAAAIVTVPLSCISTAMLPLVGITVGSF